MTAADAHPGDDNGTPAWERLTAGDTADCAQVVFGVRHHSPACSRALIAAAEELRPRAVAVEFPADLAEHLPWLGHPELVAPVAVAAAVDPPSAAASTDAAAGGMSLYPFADFSPELAIIRWAVAHGIPVHAIDLPVGAERSSGDAGENVTSDERLDTFLGPDAWDELVETPSVGVGWRQVRRAALSVGMAARLRDGGSPDPHTAARESWMRKVLADIGAGSEAGSGAVGPVLTVVGGYHSAAVLDPGDEPEDAENPDPQESPSAVSPVISSLVPYSFAQLDDRSGYPAGIRDPGWRQRMLTVDGADEVPALIAATVTDVARALRADGHPVGPAESAEATRVACDLASLRGSAAAGHGEVIEALTTVLTQGSVLGYGRAVANAMRDVLIGDHVGDTPPGVPEPALLSHTRAEATRLGMPHRERSGTSSVRIEPFAGPKGLARHVFLERLDALAVPYRADSSVTASGVTRGLENRSRTESVSWRTTTTAALSLLGASGVTLEQATELVLLSRLSDGGDPLAVIELASRTGSDRALSESLGHLDTASLGFAQAVTATELLTATAGGRQPAASLLGDTTRGRCSELAAELTGIVIRSIEGITTSDDIDDARLLGSTAALLADHSTELIGRLSDIGDTGSPLMRGAALAVVERVGESDPSTLIASWLDLGAHAESRRSLRRHLTGYLAASRGSWPDSPALDALISRVNTVEDSLFVSALPALRGAFDSAPPSERERFLDRLADALGDAVDDHLETPAALLTEYATHDDDARKRLDALGLNNIHFDPQTRWRLVLGAEPDQLPETALRMATTLDELYGDDSPGSGGTGGDGRVRRTGRRGGRGARPLGVRRWKGEIEALFGEDQVTEVFATAAERGRVDVLVSDKAPKPDDLVPSVDLLATVLNLRGAISEKQLTSLRPLVAHMVEQLSKELAARITPVIAGVAGARPSSRPNGPLDLSATLRKNLRHVTRVGGRDLVVPVNPVFRTPVRKTSPWHLIVLVDVSGSMETSTVYSALTASILAGVSTFRVSFLTFDTDVIDLSEHTDDPLSLLLEIAVGGGTDIGHAVGVAGELVSDPTRTAVIIVSDFEESGSTARLIQRVSTLVDSGVRMIGCAALVDGDDGGSGTAYNVSIARQLVAVGMRIAPVTPVQLARWVGEVLRD